MPRYVVVIAVLATQSWAKPPAKAPVSPMVEIKKELAAGEFERAIKKIDLAIKKATTTQEQATYFLARAQALLALDQPEKAQAAFLVALQKDSTIELDSTRASPDEVKLFEKARAEIPATLAVTVKGGEAHLLVDDKDMGPAPLTLQLLMGPHVIEARGAEGLMARRELTLTPGKKVDVVLELALPPKAPEVPLVVAAPQPVEPVREKVVQAPAQKSLVGLVPLIGGAVVAGVGVVLVLQAGEQHNRLVSKTLPSLTPAEQSAAVSNGAMFQTLGWVGIGVGAAALATGAVLLALPATEPQSPRVGFSVMPGGAFVTAGGVW